jgi:hypothetical protein
MPMKCMDQIAPPPIATAAPNSQSIDTRPVRRRARAAQVRPHQEPKTEMTNDSATKAGSNDPNVTDSETSCTVDGSLCESPKRTGDDAPHPFPRPSRYAISVSQRFC